MQKSFSKKYSSNRNEKNSNISILGRSKTVINEYCYDYVKPKCVEKAKLLYGYRQFHCQHKNKIFIKTLLKMLKQGLALQIMSLKDHCQKEKTRLLA